MKKLQYYIFKEMLLESKDKLFDFIKILFILGNKNAVLLIRLFQVSSKKRSLFCKVFSYLISNKLIKNYGIEISKKTEIGSNLKIGHANGIIIGEGVKIGDNVTIYHQVTIGLASVKHKGNYDLYPKIGDNCTIYSGAKILGNINLGKGTVVGSNAVVLSDTEENSVYVGIPAKRIK